MFQLPALRNIPSRWFGRSDTNVECSVSWEFCVGRGQHWQSKLALSLQSPAAGCSPPALCSISCSILLRRDHLHMAVHTPLCNAKVGLVLGRVMAWLSLWSRREHIGVTVYPQEKGSEEEDHAGNHRHEPRAVWLGIMGTQIPRV